MNEYNFPYKVNICYIINDKNQVLLQLKARGHGEGKWNGPGGKIKQDETIEQSVIREVKEETDLEVKNLIKMAELEFVMEDAQEKNNYCHVYIANSFTGKPKNTGEGELKWFDIDKLPLENMWDDDKYWLPKVLAGEYQHLRFFFKNDLVERYEEL